MTTSDKVSQVTELKLNGTKVAEACRKVGISVPTYYNFRSAQSKRGVTAITSAQTPLWKRVLTSNLTAQDKIDILNRI